MSLTVISCAYREEDGFDAGPLEEFCSGHSVTGWTDHVFMRAGCPELAFVLDASTGAAAIASSSTCVPSSTSTYFWGEGIIGQRANYDGSK